MESGVPESVNKSKILLVEDEEQTAKLLKNRLESGGFEVIWALTGPEGLQKARNEKPALIVLDIMLPGMDGYKICRLLKFDRRFRHIPVVVLTGRQQAQDFDTAKRVHADVYLTKPFQGDRLLETIKSLLEKSLKPEPTVDVPPEPLWMDGFKRVRPV